MADVIILRHPINNLVTAFSNSIYLTYDLFIFKLLITNRFNPKLTDDAIGQEISHASVCQQNQPTLREPSVNRKDLRALTLVGPTRYNPILDPLAVLHLIN